MESCLLIWNYDPTAEEERRTRCLTIRRPIIPFRAKRRGSGCAIWPPARRRSTRSRPMSACSAAASSSRGNGRSFCTIWRNSSAISGCLASGSGRPSGSPRRNRSRCRPLRCSCCACAGQRRWPMPPFRGCWIYRTIRTRSSMPRRRRRAWPICAFPCVCFP